jgi:asparagine synthase (glutamine-hydrolysing)
MSLDEAVEGFRHHLYESIRLRLRADVPLAFCLSGGVDSASLVSIAARVFGYDVAAFSISDHDPRYDERNNIRSTVDDIGCRHWILDIPREDTIDRLRRLICYHDAPVYTISYYIHSLLSELIASQGYRVAVSGTAADELVTGYYDHFNLHLYELRNHPDFERRLAEWHAGPGRFVRNPYLRNPKLYFDRCDFRDHIYLNRETFTAFLCEPVDEPFTEEIYCDSLLRNRMLNELFCEVTPTSLHEDDLNSMNCSIENRSPYLDSHLFDFACSIPSEHLIRGGLAKAVLRDAVDGVLNDRVRLDPVKKGFNASVLSLVDIHDSSTQSVLLDDGPVFELVRRDAIEAVLNQDTLPNSFSKFLFSFISTRLFLDEWDEAGSTVSDVGSKYVMV